VLHGTPLRSKLEAGCAAKHANINADAINFRMSDFLEKKTERTHSMRDLARHK
jgi:hypothetical protein